MSLITLLFIGIGLSLDSFAICITTGAVNSNVRIKILTITKVALIMAAFQALLPLIGWAIGSSFKSVIEIYDHWIAFILLLGIGGKMLYESFAGDEKEQSSIALSNNLLLMGMAIATSIDALVVGISFGVIAINILLAIVIIGLTTFAFSFSGVIMGTKLGNKMNQKIEIFGGLILIGIGLKILLSHIYF